MRKKISKNFKAKLIASDGQAEDNFGSSISLSADGIIALIGAWWADINDNLYQGAAYVFSYNGTTWQEEAKLTASDDREHDCFGSSLSLSADGTSAIIGSGGLFASGNNAIQGAAYVFKYNKGSWQQEAKLVANDGKKKNGFGSSVSLNANGTIALVGADGADVNGNNNQGAAYVFKYNGVAWQEQIKLTISNGAKGDFFGRSVSISADGTKAIVGAFGKNKSSGAAYIFSYDGTAWQEEQILTASDGAADDTFGYSVSLSTDGTTAIVGASPIIGPEGVDVGGNSEGAAYVFKYNEGTWQERQKLTANDGAANYAFGSSLSLSADSTRLIVGAYGADGVASGTGAVYIFSYNQQTGTYDIGY